MLFLRLKYINPTTCLSMIFKKEFSVLKILILFLLYNCSFNLNAQNTKFTLVIDPGHGGHDPGAIGKITREKDINLAVALKFGEMVSSAYNDVRVIYTRNSDRFISLQERADVANSNHADLFISIHTNSAQSQSAFGTESFTLGLAKTKGNLDVAMRENSVILLEDDYKSKYKGFDPTSVDSYIMFEFMQDKYLDRSVSLASDIQSNFRGFSGRSDRGVRQAGFWVLYRSACPSVLVELGFISNPEEERYLASSSGQRSMAESVYRAFAKFKYDHDKRSGRTAKKPAFAESAPVRSTETINDNGKADVVDSTAEIAAAPAVSTKSRSAIAKSKKDSLKNVKKEEVEVEKAVEKPSAAVQIVEQSMTKSRQEQSRTAQETTAPTDNQQKPTASKPVAAAENERAKENIAYPAVVDLPVYKVQLFATARKLNSNAADFKGIRNAECIYENGLYKYMVGNDTKYDVVVKLRKEMLALFPDAFIVAYSGKNKLSVNEALKITNKNK